MKGRANININNVNRLYGGVRVLQTTYNLKRSFLNEHKFRQAGETSPPLVKLIETSSSNLTSGIKTSSVWFLTLFF